jgi:hypothetical protein
MPDSVSEHLSRSPRFCKADLRALWRQSFKVAPPCQLRKSLLLPKQKSAFEISST